MRITRKHVEAKISIVNGMLGHETVEWSTVGSVRLYGAYGAYGIHRVMSMSGGIAELAPLGTLREASQFLSGMITALRITKESVDA